MPTVPPGARAALTAAAVLSGLMLVAPPARGAVSPWSQNPHGRVRLITPYTVAARRGLLRLGVHFQLSPGWHVYWKNSGDAGFPPVVGVTGGPGLGKAELLWPAPQRFDLPGHLVAFGYEKEVVYPVEARVEAAAGDRLRLVADVDYLTCAVDCVPYRYTLTLEQPLAESAVADPETSALVDRFWHRLPLAADGLAGVATEGAIDASRPGEPALSVRLRGVHGDPARVDLFLEPIADFEAGRPEASTGGDGLTFRVPLRLKQVNQKLPAATTLSWTVTGLERDGEPLSLEAKRQVPIAAGGAISSQPWPGPGALLRALLGGVLLALTPGALALLLTGLAAAPSALLARRVLARSCGILGACWVAAFFGRPGAAASGLLGAVDPRWAALVAAVSVLVALDFWGLLRGTSEPSPEGEAAGSGRAARLGGPALSGLLTALLALAWAVPPVDTPFRTAAANGPVARFVVFTAVAVGLALPVLLAALFARRIARASLPMAARGALGFLALANAAWLLYRLSREVSPEGLAWIELALLGLSLFAWLGSRSRGQGALKFIRASGVVALVLATWWLADRGRLPQGGSGDVVAPATGAAPQPKSSSTRPPFQGVSTCRAA